MDNRDKQIEEMAKILSSDCGNCKECSHYHKEINGIDSCYFKYAEMIYNAGYRKSTELAEEIFAEIDELLSPYGSYIKTIDIHEYIELKKKYTESENNK